jgi:hypothetical protein
MRAHTAETTSKSKRVTINSHDSSTNADNNDPRPKTIEGVSAPVPPTTERRQKSFRTLSPREISLVASSTTSKGDYTRDSLSWSKESDFRPSTAGITKTIGITQQNYSNSTDPQLKIHTIQRPSTALRVPTTNEISEFLPPFLRNRISTTSQTNPTTESTEKPISEEAVQTKNILLNRLKAKPVKIERRNVRIESAISSVNNQYFDDQLSDPDHSINDDHLGQSSPWRLVNRFQEKVSAMQRTNSLSKFNSQNKYKKLEQTEMSVASTVFEEMELDDIIRYIWDANNGDTSKAQFVHVACRSNIERVLRENFYDFVILERPGHPHSGHVWTRHIGDLSGSRQKDVLPRHEVMQLSMHGLLVTDEQHHSTELITLEQLLLEKEQFEFLRTGNFFGMFKELKAFSAWKKYTHHNYVQRMKKIMSKSTIFSEFESVEALLLVIRTSYEIEMETELYSFGSTGAVFVSDFLAKQTLRIEEVRTVLYNHIYQLGEDIANQYHKYMASSKLAKIIQDVKDHHPLRDVIQRTEESIDWVKLRSLQRLGDAFKEKIKAILYLAQYRIEYALASILEKFWMRMKQTILGLHSLRTHKRVVATTAPPAVAATAATAATGTAIGLPSQIWDLDLQLFHQQTGKLRETAFDRNMNISSAKTMFAAKGEEDEAVGNDEGEESNNNSNHNSNTSSAVKKSKKTISNFQTKVTKDWESLGLHLSVYVELFLSDNVVTAEDLVHLRSIDRMKVQVVPTKGLLMNQMHEVCGFIGKLFETLPNLRQHSLISEHGYKINYIDQHDVELGLGDLENPHSSKYFTFLILYPLYNSKNAYAHAIETMRLMLHAYQESCTIDFYAFKLTEIFRKLWSLSPTSLVKQMDRSFALPKIKEFIDRPDMTDDLKRSQLRDKTRLTTFQNSVNYLIQLPKTLSSFANLKNRQGMITSFDRILMRIKQYRLIQEFFLYQRLPTSYITRCSAFYDFIRKLEIAFENTNQTSQEEIQLMYRLKNFEMAKEFHDSEQELCDLMFQCITRHQQQQVSDAVKAGHGMDKTLHDVLETLQSHPQRGNRKLHAGLTPDKLYEVTIDGVERLTNTISKARSNILARLQDIRNDVIYTRMNLHRRIQETVENFNAIDITDAEKSSEWISESMLATGKEVDQLQRLVQESVSGQLILVEAHDIVGAANPIMTSNEIDKFEDMLRLEALYQHRNSAWKIIIETESISRLIAASKLANNNIADLNSKFVNLLRSFQELSIYLEDPKLIDYMDTLLKDTLPKVELVSYLSSRAIKPRHWKWLGLHVFRPCSLDIKLTGRQMEFVTVLDIKGRDPVGLGNINRLSAEEVLGR